MAFERPSLNDIIQRVEGDFKSALGLTSILRRSFIAAMSRAIAGASHVLHGHIVFVSRQIFPDQAEAELLDRWGSIYGITRNPATFGQFEIDINFTSSATVTAGTIFKRTDGLTYELDADVSETVGPFPILKKGTVTAKTFGADANLNVNDKITLETPIVGVDSEATVSLILKEGEDVETDENLRQRIVDRIQEPPSGGRAEDYIQFAKTVTGVTRVWVLPGHLGQGTVGLWFVEDDNVGSIIPSAAKVQEVQDAVTLLKPVTAELFTFAPEPLHLDMTIAIKPNTQAVRDAVTTEITSLLKRDAQVRGTLKEAGTGSTYDGKILLSRLNEAISIAEGEEDHNIISPTSDVQPPNVGGLVVAGTLTFQTLA